MSVMFEKPRRWIEQYPNWTLALITFVALLPFLVKPFNIDDPLFIWVGHQVQAHPLNPFGFNVAWDITEFPMWKITENPPLAGYFIALAASILGWSEIALHFAFILPAIAVILGTHRLAARLGANPWLAALTTLFAPVFLVSATTVMCDVSMLACWIWAVVLWVEGQNNNRKMVLAGLLISLAAMTKYFGVCLVPLLAAYSLTSRRPLRQWAQFLLIPLAVLCAYQYVTQSAYGYSLLYRAMDYATFSKSLIGFSKFQNALIALAFVGGGMATAFFLTPSSWRKNGMMILVAATTLAAGTVLFDSTLWSRYGSLHDWAQFSVKLQMIFWVAGGLCLSVLVTAEIFRGRDANSLLLVLWIAGTFYFAACCNWTVNARSILPMTPAVAILVARRLQSKNVPGHIIWPAGVIAALLAGGALTMLVARADFSAACAVRQCAQEVRARHSDSPVPLWFQGHWGFQFYMAQTGAAPLDFDKSILKPGDLLAIPIGNTSIQLPDQNQAALIDVVSISSPEQLTTWDLNVGAGFYAAGYGPLPFTFGKVSPEIAMVYVWKAPPATWFQPPK